MIYTESDKSAVFVSVICPYKQSLDELQQPDLTAWYLWNQQHILLCYIVMSGNKQWFVSNDGFIDIICSLVLPLSTFISLKYQKSIFQCVSTASYALRWMHYWISTAYVGYTSQGEGPKMINQCFNAYASRRVRCAGYATAFYPWRCATFLLPTSSATFWGKICSLQPLDRFTVWYPLSVLVLVSTGKMAESPSLRNFEPVVNALERLF